MQPYFQAFLEGLPIVLGDLGAALAVLVVGIVLYEAITPYRELRLIRSGNTAAGIALSGALLGLSIPLATALAHSVNIPDILIWGGFAVLIQLVVFAVVATGLRGMAAAIERGECASAILLAAVQISTALLIAAVMTG